jgi:hypothetical protein
MKLDSQSRLDRRRRCAAAGAAAAARARQHSDELALRQLPDIRFRQRARELAEHVA